jgi:hypothetical protein
MTKLHTLVNLGSIKNAQESNTDKFGIQKSPEPFFMTITILEPKIGGDSNGDGQLELMSTIKSIGNLAGNAVENFASSVTGSSSSNLANDRFGDRFKPTTVATSTAAEIALPMPIELQNNEGQNWGDDNSAVTDLAMAGIAQIPNLLGGSGGGSIVGTLMNAVSAQSALTAAKKIGQKGFGIGIEPRKEMFFNGPEFREFTFSWDLSPKNSTEAKAIQSAIKTLRKHKSPDSLSSEARVIGFEVWKLPSTFQVKFMQGTKENSYLPRIKSCVVLSMTVDYAKEGGWRAFEDGAPIVTGLSITFKEIEVLTQKDIEDGY